ncbi:MAG: tetratricopeptide repeat protein, partial [Hyphomicrobiaceae bacterium]|nr:tetratricopeptide repeat protein [Hyphomicrobiaceae bacterium]
DFSRAIAFDNGSTELYVLRGGAYLGVRNHAAAVRDYSRALEIDPKHAAAYAGRGLAKSYLEAFDEAFADLAKAIETDPRNPLGYAFRGVVYSETGQTEVGMKDIETALKLDAGRPETLWARGIIAEAQGRTQDAIPDIRRAVEANPEFALAAEALRRLGADLGDTADVQVAGAGIAGWNVVQRGSEFYAVSTDQSGLRIPLESPGTGQPKLIDWDVRKPPFKGIGVLRFHGGSVPAKSGVEPIELTALIDISSRTVIAVEPHKFGAKTATWTWDDGKVTVASVDGVIEEFSVRPSTVGTQPTGGGRPTAVAADGVTPLDEAAAAGAEKPKTAAVRKDPPRPAQKQPKTIFDLLFGN